MVDGDVRPGIPGTQDNSQVPMRRVAGLLQVATKSAYGWRRTRRSGEEEALASRDPGGTPASWTTGN